MIIYKVYEADPDGCYEIAYYRSLNNALSRLEKEVIEYECEFVVDNLNFKDDVYSYYYNPMCEIAIKKVKVEDFNIE